MVERYHHYHEQPRPQPQKNIGRGYGNDRGGIDIELAAPQQPQPRRQEGGGREELGEGTSHGTAHRQRQRWLPPVETIFFSEAEGGGVAQTAAAVVAVSNGQFGDVGVDYYHHHQNQYQTYCSSSVTTVQQHQQRQEEVGWLNSGGGPFLSFPANTQGGVLVAEHQWFTFLSFFFVLVFIDVFMRFFNKIMRFTHYIFFVAVSSRQIGSPVAGPA
jgi:hypothetical protein